MSYETVDWEHRDGVGQITLNRPETVNAWNGQLGEELGEVINERAADPQVRAVLIRGAGKGFSSGVDLKGGGLRVHPTDDRPDVLHELHDVYHPILRGVRNLEKPVVAAVHGAAAGIGCSLALACDLILAAESSFFSLAFVHIGLMPDGGSTLFVPAAVGKARAFEMALLGERVPAPQAREWGLVNSVHADEDLFGDAERLVGRLAAGPTRSYAGAKKALNASLYPHLEAQFDLEADLQHALARTDDFVEGVGAFLQQRKPDFTGN
ncbi:MAG: enoyl-CoA hydratase [Thermoleophilaceae bacterium]